MTLNKRFQCRRFVSRVEFFITVQILAYINFTFKKHKECENGSKGTRCYTIANRIKRTNNTFDSVFNLNIENIKQYFFIFLYRYKKKYWNFRIPICDGFIHLRRSEIPKSIIFTKCLCLLLTLPVCYPNSRSTLSQILMHEI